jgi:hypothetical protein
MRRAALRAWAGWLVSGVVLGALAIGFVWFLQATAARAGRVVDAGPVDAFLSAGPAPAPVLFARDDFYLVKTAEGEPRALYVYPRPAQMQNRPGCAVVWRPEFQFDGRTSFFREECFGTTFTLEGRLVFGPFDASLDQFRVEMKDGRLLVDTRRLVCDGGNSCKRLK